jgi:hypothetical protein
MGSLVSRMVAVVLLPFCHLLAIWKLTRTLTRTLRIARERFLPRTLLYGRNGDSSFLVPVFHVGVEGFCSKR